MHTLCWQLPFAGPQLAASASALQQPAASSTAHRTLTISRCPPQMYESDDIISYLFKQYGDGEVPLALRLGTLTALTCSLGLAPRYSPCMRNTSL